MNTLHIIYVYVATVKYLCVYLCQIILSQIIVVVIKWLKVIKVMIIVMILQVTRCSCRTTSRTKKNLNGQGLQVNCCSQLQAKKYLFTLCCYQDLNNLVSMLLKCMQQRKQLIMHFIILLHLHKQPTQTQIQDIGIIENIN